MNITKRHVIFDSANICGNVGVEEKRYKLMLF